MNKRILKSTCGLLIVLVMIFGLSVPCFAQEGSNYAVLGPEDKPQNAGEGTPDWFPEGDPDDLVRFHNDNAARVVDYAGIFTENEREELAKKLAEMKEKFGYDFVFLSEDYVYEDVNDYFYDNLSEYYDTEDYNYYRQYYSGYFYDFNGYGVGDDFDGIILYVNLTDYKRGWFSCATGACKNFLTESTVNSIDDRLELYMRDGNYSAGIFDYFDNLENMLSAALDHTDFPSWYPEDTASFVRGHDDAAPRLIDDADLLTDKEEAQIESKISEMKENYGYDFVVLTENFINSSYDYYCGILGEKYTTQYESDYYYYNGYGFGDNYSGAILYINLTDDYLNTSISYFGDCENLISDENLDKMMTDLSSCIIDADEYYKGVNNFFENSETVFLGKRLIIADDVEGALVVGATGGAIVAAIVMAVCLLKMRTVKKATNANRYVTSFDLTRNRDIYLNTTTTRKKIESSSSSGGGSHFSGGFSGGGGSSHSGGGRSF